MPGVVATMGFTAKIPYRAANPFMHHLNKYAKLAHTTRLSGLVRMSEFPFEPKPGKLEDRGLNPLVQSKTFTIFSFLSVFYP